MNEIRKLIETIEKISEAPPRKKVRKLRKKKLVRKKAGKKMQMSGKKVWMFGDEDFEKVSGSIPVTFMQAYLEANQADDYEKREELIATLAKNTSSAFARVFQYAWPYSDELPEMQKVLRGGSAGFGEAEFVAGYGPTKAKAKAQYALMQDDSEEESDDWDY